jgi:hypothetical protein
MTHLADILSGPVGWALMACWLVVEWRGERMWAWVNTHFPNLRLSAAEIENAMAEDAGRKARLRRGGENPPEPVDLRPEPTPAPPPPIGRLMKVTIGDGEARQARNPLTGGVPDWYSEVTTITNL